MLAGYFTVWKKFLRALIENAIFYISLLIIVVMCPPGPKPNGETGDESEGEDEPAEEEPLTSDSESDKTSDPPPNSSQGQ